jgi:hypothetical protein
MVILEFFDSVFSIVKKASRSRTFQRTPYDFLFLDIRSKKYLATSENLLIITNNFYFFSLLGLSKFIFSDSFVTKSKDRCAFSWPTASTTILKSTG